MQTESIARVDAVVSVSSAIINGTVHPGYLVNDWNSAVFLLVACRPAK
jgi:hypothetical protein